MDRAAAATTIGTTKLNHPIDSPLFCGLYRTVPDGLDDTPSSVVCRRGSKNKRPEPFSSGRMRRFWQPSLRTAPNTRDIVAPFYRAALYHRSAIASTCGALSPSQAGTYWSGCLPCRDVGNKVGLMRCLMRPMSRPAGRGQRLHRAQNVSMYPSFCSHCLLESLATPEQGVFAGAWLFDLMQTRVASQHITTRPRLEHSVSCSDPSL